jgi:hypothetical protein
MYLWLRTESSISDPFIDKGSEELESSTLLFKNVSEKGVFDINTNENSSISILEGKLEYLNFLDKVFKKFLLEKLSSKKNITIDEYKTIEVSYKAFLPLLSIVSKEDFNKLEGGWASTDPHDLKTIVGAIKYRIFQMQRKIDKLNVEIKKNALEKSFIYKLKKQLNFVVKYKEISCLFASALVLFGFNKFIHRKNAGLFTKPIARSVDFVGNIASKGFESIGNKFK